MDYASGVDVVKRGLELHVPARELCLVDGSRLDIRKRAHLPFGVQNQIHDEIEQPARRVFAKFMDAQEIRMPQKLEGLAFGLEAPP